MKALILRGKYNGRVAEVSQWCNDWFTLDSEDDDITRKVWSPTSLAFTKEDFYQIVNHKNNGMLFSWFEPKLIMRATDYTYGFQKRKHPTGSS